MDQLIQENVQAIIDGTLSTEDAVAIISRRSKKPAAMVRARLAVVLKLTRNYQDIKVSKSSAPGPLQTPVVHDSPSRTAGGTVSPDEFMAVMKEHALTKKQAAVAIGRSVSRVHELTVTRGGSEALLASFKEKLAAFHPTE